MNWEHVEGNWKQLRGKVRERWGKLTDDDFDIIAGKRHQLVGKLQATYGDSKEVIETQIEEWGRQLDEDLRAVAKPR